MPEETGGTAVATEGVTSTETVTPETAAPETAAPSEETPTPEPSTPSGTKYLTRREAREQMHAEMRQRQEAADAEAAEAAAAEAKVDEKGRAHAKDGKYLPGDVAGDEKTADAEETAADDTKPEPAEKPQATEQNTDPEKADADTTAADELRVTIDPKHPVAQMGEAVIEAANPQQAQVIQALLNGTYTRRKEVEALQTEVGQLRQQLQERDEEVIGYKSHQTAAEKFKSTPEYKKAVQEHDQILEEQGEEAAKRYWKGVQTEFNEVLRAEREQATSALQEREAQAAAERWQKEAWTELHERLPENLRSLPDLESWFKEEVELFNDRMEKGRYPHVKTREQMHVAFRKLMSDRLLHEPTVREIARAATEAESRQKSEAAREKVASERSIEEAKKAGAEEVVKAAATARDEVPPNPAASLPSPAGDLRTGVGANQDDDLSRMSPAQVRKHSKQAARQDAARHLKP